MDRFRHLQERCGVAEIRRQADKSCDQADSIMLGFGHCVSRDQFLPISREKNLLVDRAWFRASFLREHATQALLPLDPSQNPQGAYAGGCCWAGAETGKSQSADCGMEPVG